MGIDFRKRMKENITPNVIKKQPMWAKSKMPMMREITLGEIIETVVSNKGSQCKTDDLMVEVEALMRIRNRECRNLVNNVMGSLISEVRGYE